MLLIIQLCIGKKLIEGDRIMDSIEDGTAVATPQVGSSAIGEFIANLRYSPEEKERFAKIIRDFSDLYYEMSVQTWGNTRWRGVPVLKTPTDLWIYQELIEQIRPDFIIETGTCYGGSALYMRDILNMIFKSGHIMSVDITHEHLAAKAKVEGVEYVLGSSVADETIAHVKKYIEDAYARRIIVMLDSDHSKEHVLKELALYAPLIPVGGVLIVEDTNAEGPYQAVQEWAPQHPEFRCEFMCEKFMLTFNRGGYFERVA